MFRLVTAEQLPVRGYRRGSMFKRNGAITYDWETTGWQGNLIVNTGKDSIFRRIQPTGFGGDGVSGGGQLSQVGVGNGNAVPALTDIALSGASQLFKNISESTYVRPTLYVAVTFGYSEANFAWNEYGVKDTNGNLVSRAIETGTVLTKDSSKIAICEWQFTL